MQQQLACWGEVANLQATSWLTAPCIAARGPSLGGFCRGMHTAAEGKACSSLMHRPHPRAHGAHVLTCRMVPPPSGRRGPLTVQGRSGRVMPCSDTAHAHAVPDHLPLCMQICNMKFFDIGLLDAATTDIVMRVVHTCDGNGGAPQVRSSSTGRQLDTALAAVEWLQTAAPHMRGCCSPCPRHLSLTLLCGRCC